MTKKELIKLDSKEQQLEEISKKVNNYRPNKNPPIYEMFVTMISIALSVVLFLFPEMLTVGYSEVYALLISLMPQWLWAFTFFGAGMMKAVGMLLDNKYLRIGGLIVSALIYLVFTISYASAVFPSIGAVVFTAITVFSLISIPEVKRTGLRD